jgi:hypothetical protein
MTDKREIRIAELRRLRKRSLVLTVSALVIPAASWLVRADHLIRLTHYLIRRFAITWDSAAWLITPLFAIIPIVGIIFFILIIKNAKAINKLGCIECGAPKPFFRLKLHGMCPACGARDLKVL